VEVDPKTECEQGDDDHPAAQTGERAEQTGGKGTDEQDEAEEKNGHGGENRRGVKGKTARNYEKTLGFRREGACDAHEMPFRRRI
jgi:hypothetical protein